MHAMSSHQFRDRLHRRLVIIAIVGMMHTISLITINILNASTFQGLVIIEQLIPIVVQVLLPSS